MRVTTDSKHCDTTHKLTNILSLKRRESQDFLKTKETRMRATVWEQVTSLSFTEKEKEFVPLFEILVVLIDRQCSVC